MSQWLEKLAWDYERREWGFVPEDVALLVGLEFGGPFGLATVAVSGECLRHVVCRFGIVVDE